MGELKGQLLAVLAVVIAFGAVAGLAKTFLSDTTDDISEYLAGAEGSLGISQVSINVFSNELLSY